MHDLLPPKQQQIYEYILSFSDEHGYPPSIREIAEHIGLKSPSTVHFHLKGLRNAGLISQPEGKTRAITVLARDPAMAQPKADCVPLLGNVAAGTPILAQEYIEEYITFRPDGPMEEYFALKVRGDSMLNAGILPDDIVIVHQQQTAHNGDIVVALFEDEATVKVLSRKNGETWLLPQNPSYDPIDGSNAQIVGKVAAVVRRY
ncbi:MAG: SOS-response repressor and protease LexA [Oscillospiraceae bacterium]|nr:SOS-response repressor and protease LexA [Oscillospiraceae bacterium]